MKNFRCFQQVNFIFNNRLVVITGDNGSGKTSLLEALYFGCYLRSFRTHISRELVRFHGSNNTFFIKLMVNRYEDEIAYNHEIMVGFSAQKKSVKIDQQSIQSYKDLLNFYRVISLTSDDIGLINGPPEKRRSFLDQALIMDANDLTHLRQFKTVLDNRNALLAGKVFNKESFDLWTAQLWQLTVLIQQQRSAFLQLINTKVSSLISQWFNDTITIQCSYKPKKETGHTLEHFLAKNTALIQFERDIGRSLFGVHLDDFSIDFGGKASRYASRGQQKLITFLLKVAQMELLIEKRGPLILIIDDFMADFDGRRVKILLNMLMNLSISQLIFTFPSHDDVPSFLKDQGAQIVKLTS